MLLARLLWIAVWELNSLPGLAQPGQSVLPLRTYRGQVLNTSRQPLVGASVLVKGTRTAVTTNAEGLFVLALPVGSYELLVDYPGHIGPQVFIRPPDSVTTITLRSTQPPVRRR